MQSDKGRRKSLKDANVKQYLISEEKSDNGSPETDEIKLVGGKIEMEVIEATKYMVKVVWCGGFESFI
ncbi:conserved hypothetical protein [Ricinus communis]|uniref:Uncharacterized protein n=1 Tax=Ricinus communis TaxID=3988 RepID=B9R9J7_RICCO|nr:conserved hypothetical protein [Ricinus communis]